MKAVVDFFHASLEIVRHDVERLTPHQRFACDLRSVDRQKGGYLDFARSAHWEQQAADLEKILAAFWSSGDPRAVREPALAALIPNTDSVGRFFIGTAQSLVVQLQYAIEAAKLGDIEAAMKSIESSYETAYMHAQESDNGEGDTNSVRITLFNSAKFAEDSERWLAEVHDEVLARTSDLRDPRLSTAGSGSLSSLR